ncbi:MAG: GtrA family protein [Candidatus Magasanikbacteria bacterium]|nr:GtrA family protein [Candidatus Magasanikbacteria bacterium]
MIKKIVVHLWTLRHQFSRYFIIGVSAVILDIGTLYLLKEYLQIPPVWAVVINQAVLLNYVFWLNKHWSFRGSGVTHQQAVRFGILAGLNYAFSVGWMWLGNHQLQFNYLLVRLANIILSVGWNFLLYKYWVYRPSVSLSAPAATSYVGVNKIAAD